MGEAIAALLWMGAELVLVFTGRCIVAAASLGRWRAEQLRSNANRIHGPAGALWFERDGQRVVTVTGLLFVGILFYVLIALVLVWWFAPS